MRRLYESDAVERDDDSAFVPGSREDASRSHVDFGKLSHALVPMRLRPRAITVAVETSQDSYARGERVPFRVHLTNRYPIPIVLRTVSPVRWSWAVDGVERASHVPDADPPDRATLLEFSGRETKIFERSWSGKIRQTETDWETIDRGTHTLEAWVNVDDPEGDALRAETAFRVE